MGRRAGIFVVGLRINEPTGGSEPSVLGLIGAGVEYQGPATDTDGYGMSLKAKAHFVFAFGWKPLLPAEVLGCV